MIKEISLNQNCGKKQCMFNGPFLKGCKTIVSSVSN